METLRVDDILQQVADDIQAFALIFSVYADIICKVINLYHGCAYMGEYSINYSIIPDDRLNFNMNHIMREPSGRTSLLKTRLLMPLLCIYTLLVFFFAGYNYLFGFAVLTVMLFIGCVVWWIAAPKFTKNSLRKRLEKEYRAENSLFSHSGTLYFNFTEGFLTDFTEKGEFKIYFYGLTHCYETKDAFYFYMAPNKAIILPYRCFGSFEEKAYFDKLLHDSFPADFFYI